MSCKLYLIDNKNFILLDEEDFIKARNYKWRLVFGRNRKTFDVQANIVNGLVVSSITLKTFLFGKEAKRYKFLNGNINDYRKENIVYIPEINQSVFDYDPEYSRRKRNKLPKHITIQHTDGRQYFIGKIQHKRIVYIKTSKNFDVVNDFIENKIKELGLNDQYIYYKHKKEPLKIIEENDE